jgi:predicted transcriptional regulator
MQEPSTDEAMRVTADVVVAYIATRPVEPGELVALIREVRAALQGEPSAVAPAAAAPIGVEPALASSTPPVRVVSPISAADSITDEYLISFEDGHRYRSLKRHLRSKYGMTPDDYRKKWGLPPDYPMVAPALARSRSQAAIESGFGSARKPLPALARKTSETS